MSRYPSPIAHRPYLSASFIYLYDQKRLSLRFFWAILLRNPGMSSKVNISLRSKGRKRLGQNRAVPSVVSSLTSYSASHPTVLWRYSLPTIHFSQFSIAWESYYFAVAVPPCSILVSWVAAAATPANAIPVHSCNDSHMLWVRWFNVRFEESLGLLFLIVCIDLYLENNSNWSSSVLCSTLAKSQRIRVVELLDHQSLPPSLEG